MAYNQNLSQKTLIADTPEEIDRLCEEFRLQHQVQATQCRDTIYQIKEEVKTKYIRILFYVSKKEEKTGNKTGPTIDSPVSTAKTVEEPKEELWTDCPSCQARWKYSHYQRCKCGNNTPLESIKETYIKIWGEQQ